jgi:hypothetical protein
VQSATLEISGRIFSVPKDPHLRLAYDCGNVSDLNMVTIITSPKLSAYLETRYKLDVIRELPMFAIFNSVLLTDRHGDHEIL